MSVFAKELKISAVMTAVLVIILCGAYPIAVFAMAQGLFPSKANGSILYHNGTPMGSKLLGQEFISPRYFHPRPSAAGEGYDGRASGGSNLGPTSKDLINKVQERIEKYREENDLAESAPVPADAVMASGSGLDPHISVNNAVLQASRISKTRGWDICVVLEVIEKHVERRTLGVLGEPRVNVLLLNIALDQQEKSDK
jgi:potassium-transporting ATPase KdpC subunit